MNFYIKIGASFIILSFVSKVHEISNNISKLFVIFLEECGKEMRNHLAPRKFFNSREKHMWAHICPYTQIYRSSLHALCKAAVTEKRFLASGN